MINKYIGDCVMVVFAPIFDCEDFADKALLAAKGMREELKRFQEDYPEYNAKFGIGIHVGPLVAGNIGTQDRSEYTVIGDTVNVAARLESETKAQGVDLLFSEDLVESLKDQTATW